MSPFRARVTQSNVRCRQRAAPQKRLALEAGGPPARADLPSSRDEGGCQLSAATVRTGSDAS